MRWNLIYFRFVELHSLNAALEINKTNGFLLLSYKCFRRVYKPTFPKMHYKYDHIFTCFPKATLTKWHALLLIAKL